MITPFRPRSYVRPRSYAQPWSSAGICHEVWMNAVGICYGVMKRIHVSRMPSPAHSQGGVTVRVVLFIITYDNSTPVSVVCSALVVCLALVVCPALCRIRVPVICSALVVCLAGGRRPP